MNNVSSGFVVGSVAVVAGIIALAKIAENAADKCNGNQKKKQMQKHLLNGGTRLWLPAITAHHKVNYFDTFIIVEFAPMYY